MAPNSAYAADYITWLIIFDTVCTAPFFSLVFLKLCEPTKKCPYDMMPELSFDK